MRQFSFCICYHKRLSSFLVVLLVGPRMSVRRLQIEQTTLHWLRRVLVSRTSSCVDSFFSSVETFRELCGLERLIHPIGKSFQCLRDPNFIWWPCFQLSELIGQL